MARRKIAQRARAIGRAAVSPRSTFMQGVAGAGAYFAHKVGADNIDFIQKKWYAGPIILGVLGHLMKRRPGLREVGSAVIGAAGYAGAMGFKMRESAQQQGATEAGMVYDTSGLSTGLPDYTPTADAPQLEAMYRDAGDVYDDADVSSAMSLG